MRCDDVFEILTSGPFPSGASSDDLVERHLHSCFECRRLAVALGPVLSKIPDHRLPKYEGCMVQGDSTATTLSLSDRIQSLIQKEYDSQEVERRKQRREQGSFARLAVACAAVFLLGAAAAFAGPMFVQKVSPKSNTLASVGERHLNDKAGGICESEVLTHLRHANIVPVSYRDTKNACCLQCHGGTHPKETQQQTVGLIVMSCQKCHSERTEGVKL
jgi:hypothetical protein